MNNSSNISIKEYNDLFNSILSKLLFSCAVGSSILAWYIFNSNIEYKLFTWVNNYSICVPLTEALYFPFVYLRVKLRPSAKFLLNINEEKNMVYKLFCFCAAIKLTVLFSIITQLIYSIIPFVISPCWLNVMHVFSTQTLTTILATGSILVSDFFIRSIDTARVSKIYKNFL